MIAMAGSLMFRLVPVEDWTTSPFRAGRFNSLFVFRLRAR